MRIEYFENYFIYFMRKKIILEIISPYLNYTFSYFIITFPLLKFVNFNKQNLKKYKFKNTIIAHDKFISSF